MHSKVHFSADDPWRQPPAAQPGAPWLAARVHLVAGRRVVRLLCPFALLLLLLLCVGFGPPILTDGGYPPVRLAPENIDALVRSRTAPTVTATAALVIDLETGAPLFQKAADRPLPPASTAKLMTALVVVDQMPLDEVVQVTERAAATEGSRMGLTAGEQLTVGQLLQGLLIPSGNDAAVALAEHVAGSEADFVAMMNARAASLGLTATHFVNVHGLDAPGQTTSAADLAVITRIVLQNIAIDKIVATPSARVAGHALQNTNELLGTYAGADGVKTGTTDEAGECLVATVTRGGRRTLLVELGSRERFVDATRLFDYVRDAYAWRDISLPGSALSWLSDGSEKARRLRSGATSAIVVPAWQRPLLTPLVVIQPGAVVTGTLPIGELRWVFGAETIARTPLSVWQGP